MAQVGCFVPAERAILGISDRLFSRIHSLETATAQGQSSFTIDLNQVKSNIRIYPVFLFCLDFIYCVADRINVTPFNYQVAAAYR